VIVASLVAVASFASAQTAPSSAEAALAKAAAEQGDVATGPPATFTYANRPIVEFRASLLGRPPAERVAAARLAVDRLVDEGISGTVETQTIGTLTIIRIDGRYIFAILPADVDALAGETQAGTAALAASRLQNALNEMGELRHPREVIARVGQVLLPPRRSSSSPGR
jgi:hypothetical protein